MNRGEYRRAAVDEDWELPIRPSQDRRAVANDSPAIDGTRSASCLQECWGCLVLLSLVVAVGLWIRASSLSTIDADLAAASSNNDGLSPLPAWLPPSPLPTPSSPPPPPSLLLLALQQPSASPQQGNPPPSPLLPPPSPTAAALGACPWLTDGLSLRDDNPPRWCSALAGQRLQCERAYVRVSPGVFRRCAYDDDGGRCISVPEEERCASADGAGGAGGQDSEGGLAARSSMEPQQQQLPAPTAKKKAKRSAASEAAAATTPGVAPDAPSARQPPTKPPTGPQREVQPEQQLQPTPYDASSVHPRYPKASDKCSSRAGVSDAEVEYPTEVTSAAAPTLLNFYVYRAQDATFAHSPPHLENVNVANLPGVLLYLHYEAGLGGCPRKFGITRILRFNLTTYATQAAYDTWPDERRKHKYGHQFAPFAAYDFGQAKDAQRQPGFPTVGCAGARHLQQFYYNSFLKTRGHAYQGATYYSLPGGCSAQPTGKKTDACRAADRGGECPAGVMPDGVRCTWSAHPLGEVTLDELSDRGRDIRDIRGGPRPRLSPGAGDAGDGGAARSGGHPSLNLSRHSADDGEQEQEQEQEAVVEKEMVLEEETYEAFCARGGFEWKEECDCGGPCVSRGSAAEECSRQHSCFWDGRMDARRNAERVAELNRRFLAKYPAVPGDVRPPTCQWQ